jgi:Mor family transcriptional regulator
MIDQYDIQIEDLPDAFREIAQIVGIDAALALVKICGGEEIYVPKAERIARSARDRAIRAKFNGANQRELARQYKLTVSYVRTILAAGKTSSGKSGVDVVDKQLPLF